MQSSTILLLSFIPAFFLPNGLTAFPATEFPPPKIYRAAPSPPPVESPSKTIEFEITPLGPSGTLYSIGEPTDEEQYFVELINRSRADANAEAQRIIDIFNNQSDPDIVGSLEFFNVDLQEIVNQFATLDQNVQPLSINEFITNAARRHSLDMFNNRSSPPFPVKSKWHNLY